MTAVTINDLEELRMRNIKKRAIERQIASLRLTAQSATQNFSSTRISGPGDKVGDTVSRILDLQAEFQSQVDHIVEMTKQANIILALMKSEREQTILIEYYINGETLEAISEILDLSVRWLIELKKMALENFYIISSALHCTSP